MDSREVKEGDLGIGVEEYKPETSEMVILYRKAQWA
jgi:hypothetical protein